jgi:outer membrane murein-binding lipoprotein Lpp
MRLRTLVGIATLVLVAGCGGGSAEQVADLEKKVNDLTARVKSLEDQQLAADKKTIQHQQALSIMNQRLKEQETYIGKLQYGQTSVR